MVANPHKLIKIFKKSRCQGGATVPTSQSLFTDASRNSKITTQNHRLCNASDAGVSEAP